MNYLLTHEETKRLRFRLLKETDFNEWMALFDVKNAGLFLGFGKNLTKQQLCKKWFEKCFSRYEENRGGMNVLIDKSSQKLIGQCGLLLQTIEGEKRLEIGYSILPKYWGQGYATEAAIKHRNFAFENNYWKDLISMIHVDNIASEKVAIKNGMTLEKTIKESDGGMFNIFRITKKEWRENDVR